MSVRSQESGVGSDGRRCVLVFICLFAVELLWFTPRAVGGRTRVTRDLEQQGPISKIMFDLQRITLLKKNIQYKMDRGTFAFISPTSLNPV